jgi:hypothetical protein
MTLRTGHSHVVWRGPILRPEEGGGGSAMQRDPNWRAVVGERVVIVETEEPGTVREALPFERYVLELDQVPSATGEAHLVTKELDDLCPM